MPPSRKQIPLFHKQFPDILDINWTFLEITDPELSKILKSLNRKKERKEMDAARPKRTAQAVRFGPVGPLFCWSGLVGPALGSRSFVLDQILSWTSQYGPGCNPLDRPCYPHHSPSLERNLTWSRLPVDLHDTGREAFDTEDIGNVHASLKINVVGIVVDLL